MGRPEVVGVGGGWQGFQLDPGAESLVGVSLSPPPTRNRKEMKCWTVFHSWQSVLLAILYTNVLNMQKSQSRCYTYRSRWGDAPPHPLLPWICPCGWLSIRVICSIWMTQNWNLIVLLTVTPITPPYCPSFRAPDIEKNRYSPVVGVAYYTRWSWSEMLLFWIVADSRQNWIVKCCRIVSQRSRCAGQTCRVCDRVDNVLVKIMNAETCMR